MRRTLSILTIFTFFAVSTPNLTDNNKPIIQNNLIEVSSLIEEPINQLTPKRIANWIARNKKNHQLQEDFNHEIIQYINLHTIKNTEPQTILAALQQQYPKVKVSELTVEISERNVSRLIPSPYAIIRVKKDSLYYPKQGLWHQKVIFTI